MSLANRYSPSHPQGQSCQYALDFSAILPPGVAVASGSLQVELNTVPPTATTELVQSNVNISGRRVYGTLAGGVSSHDYRLTWTAVDSLGNTWPRACLLLCSATS